MPRAGLLLLAPLVAGCVDVFELPLLPRGELGPAGDLAAADLTGDLPDGGGEDIAFTDGPVPNRCALLGCTPAGNEGDVTIDGGDVSGCHAYDRLTIGLGTIRVRGSFQACATTISILGSLSAVGEGGGEGMGAGAGQACPLSAGASGGSHGGRGADPRGCGQAAVYGDAMLPRTPGSGGGGSEAGDGGGVIELVAERVAVNGFLLADGEPGSLAAGAGGSGGSVLIRADVTGTGNISARGGQGFGINPFSGGGGGGGRVAIYGNVASSIKVDVSGGNTADGADGEDGTYVNVP